MSASASTAVGSLPCQARAATIYSKSSMIATPAAAPFSPPQLPVEHWHDVVGDPTFGDGILDRLLNNAHRRTLKALP